MAEAETQKEGTAAKDGRDGDTKGHQKSKQVSRESSGAVSRRARWVSYSLALILTGESEEGMSLV